MLQGDPSPFRSSSYSELILAYNSWLFGPKFATMPPYGELLVIWPKMCTQTSLQKIVGYLAQNVQASLHMENCLLFGPKCATKPPYGQ